jgi:hypothetical protein
MKLTKLITTLSIALIFSLTGFTFIQTDHVEFSCLKKNKSTNTCHFNFKIDGEKYRFVDTGCKFEKKKDDIVKKAKEGELALAKDWKIDCPEAKAETSKKAEGF